MSAIEDGAMQDKAGGPVDALVKRLRRMRARTVQRREFYISVADALESQSAELTRLREFNAELERRLFPEDCPPADQERDHLAEQCATLGKENASLEATVREMREALIGARRHVASQNAADGLLEGFGPRKPRPSDAALAAVDAAIASSESVESEGEKDGE